MKKTVSNIFFILIVGLLFVDIGNPDALRQGTEGFYLLISQEMYEANDLLTPRVYGDFHWSKPPFQFWLPMPFYYVFGNDFLLWGRVSILIFSLVCCFLISLWYEKELKRNWFEVFGLLLCPLYFIKYARIFMMEMALAYLTTLCALYFYSYVKKNKTSTLLVGSLFGALSILVKGPVSLIMLTPPIGLLSLKKERSFPSKAFFFLSLATVFGSLWFLLSYLRFGNEFFQYFFIRENLGKFNAKNYPISSVIQGLFIYSFPVFLLIIPIFKNLKKKVFKADVNLYLTACFCCFYFLWFLPKQKSHHYAVPAIPVLIIFISYNFNEYCSNLRSFYSKLLSLIGHFLFGLGLFILALLYIFKESLALPNAQFYLMGSFFCLALWSHLNKRIYKKLFFLKYILPFIFLWQFLLPLGALPTVPYKVSNLVSKHIQNENTLFVSYRKPFFIQESLNQEIVMLKNDNPLSDEVKSGDLIFLGRGHQSEQKLPGLEVLHRWKVWKRGVGFAHVAKALEARSLSSLQETFSLVKKH
jgi:4-amino-4-deoxy-L-arabinose transferase-like glycosyltransferase